MNRVSNIITLLFFSFSLTSCSSTTITLYHGEMELVTVSGGGCSEKYQAGSHIPLELTLERSRIGNSQQIGGYLSGPDIQSGRLLGNNSEQLQVLYPDESDSTPRGHTLELSITPEEAAGELHEKPQADPTNCYFEKAILKLKRETAANEAKAGYNRQSNIFNAEVYYLKGQSLLKIDKPEEAIHYLTKSLNLRSMVDHNDPARAYPAVSIAVAHIIDGRETNALEILRNLFEEKNVALNTMLKQRMAVSDSLCNDILYLESDAGKKASMQLLDIATREFGSLNGVGETLAACYYELGSERKEQDDPDSAIELFKKALRLNPDDPDIITGVVTSLVDKESPAEGRRYLQEHSQVFAKKNGRELYDSFLSILYVAEAQQLENRGDLPRAEQLYREALKVRPDVRALVIKLTRVLGKEAKFDEARKLLEDGRTACGNETCRQEYADEVSRQDLIERLVKRLEKHAGSQ